MNPHFGKLGDVWKHLLLAEVLRHRPPLHYWETHAGSAHYPLTEIEERLHGAIQFAVCAPEDPDLQACAYLDALRSAPDIYPGSPMLAIRSLGKDAEYLFCDIDPESVRTLSEATAGVNGRVVEGDGVSAVDQAALLASACPSDVVVHIDPFNPYERLASNRKTPIELAGSLATAGYRVIYWYGYDSVDRRGWARTEIAGFAPEIELWCGDVLIPAPFIYPKRRDAWGCGVVLANATSAESSLCERLGHALERISSTDILEDNEPDRLTFQVVR